MTARLGTRRKMSAMELTPAASISSCPTAEMENGTSSTDCSRFCAVTTMTFDFPIVLLLSEKGGRTAQERDSEKCGQRPFQVGARLKNVSFKNSHGIPLPLKVAATSAYRTFFEV